MSRKCSNVAYRALEFHREDLHAEAAKARRVAEARPTRTGQPSSAATARQRVGLALHDLGRRLQRRSAQSVGHGDSSVATTGTPS